MCICYINIFEPHKAHTCMHHTCHLRLARWILQLFYKMFARICKKVLLAAVGSTFLKSGTPHFTSTKIIFWTPKRQENEALWSFSAPLKFKETSEKCVFPAYGPVWVRHKAKLYALHLPFDVYMPKVMPKWLKSNPNILLNLHILLPQVTLIYQKSSLNDPNYMHYTCRSTSICPKWRQSDPK